MKTRNVLGILALAGAVYLGKTCLRDTPNSYLSHQDFQNMQWCPVRNTNGVIWDDYMRTKNIPKNAPNWALYQIEVNEKNKGKLEGKIEVPCRFTIFR